MEIASLSQSKMKNENIDALTVYPWGNCNLSCSYCRYKRNSNELELKDFKKTIILLKKINPGFNKITFLGGEPLIKFNKLKKMIEFARFFLPESEINVFTNGTLLSEDIFSFFQKKKVNVVISMDGFEEINDRQRNSLKGNLSVSNKIFSFFKGHFKDISFSLVVTCENVKFLSSNIRKFSDLGVQALGWNIDYSSLWDKNSVSELKKQLAQIRLDYLKLLRKGRPYIILNRYEILEEIISGKSTNCNSVSLFPDGNLYACDKFFPASRRGAALLVQSDILKSRKKFFDKLSKEGIRSRGLFCPVGIYCYFKFVKSLKGKNLIDAFKGAKKLALIIEKEEEKSLKEYLKYGIFRRMHSL